MKNIVLVLGYFGCCNNQLDGQTIKTRNVYELLLQEGKGKFAVDFFDTQKFKFSKLSFFILLYKLLRSGKLIYLPAHNNLKYLFPLIYFLCWLKRCEIIYFVVGGWLDEYLSTKKLHTKLLSRIKAILVESDSLKDSLVEKYQFKNVVTFPNFRMHSFKPDLSRVGNKFKIVFMARINKMKGIDHVFNLADFISMFPAVRQNISIDFFGPVEKEDETYFYDRVKKYSSITYKGLLQPECIYETLSEYDLMLFPTRYYTEGFPGTILDAYISGLPVVATNWKHAKDFIVDGQTGFIVPFESGEDEFCRSVIQLYQQPDLLLRMKKQAYLRSMKFTSDYAWSIISDNRLMD